MPVFPDRTPRPILTAHQRKRPKSSSPRKAGRSLLENLDKPFDFELFPASHKLAQKELPADVLPLYRELFAAQQKIGILPAEIRYEMEDEATDASFRPAATAEAGAAASADAVIEARVRADTTHVRVCYIVQKTAEATIYNRHESTWNDQVHTPLFELVFTSTPLGTKIIAPFRGRTAGTAAVEAPTRQRGVSARYEKITGASTDKGSRPALAQRGYTDADSVVSGSSAASRSTTTSRSIDGDDARSTATATTRGGSNGDHRKVDYVVVMDVPRTAPLHLRVHAAASRLGDAIPYFNHSAYRPLEQSLIALSFETKTHTSHEEPIHQLGMWAAAWHRRMAILREALFPLRGIDEKAGTRSPRLVTLPLVQVVGHLWQVHFAADLGSSIQIYGPMTIGSTENILETYVLLASLGALKRWVEGTFQDGMKSWFGVEDAASE